MDVSLGTSTRDSTDILLVVALAVVAIVVFVPLVMMLLAVPMMGTMGGWTGGWMGGSQAGASPLWGVLTMLLWLAVLVALGYGAYRVVTRTGLRGGDPALQELRVAYARGDLTEEEYEERRATLEADR